MLGEANADTCVESARDATGVFVRQLALGHFVPVYSTHASGFSLVSARGLSLVVVTPRKRGHLSCFQASRAVWESARRHNVLSFLAHAFVSVGSQDKRGGKVHCVRDCVSQVSKSMLPFVHMLAVLVENPTRMNAGRQTARDAKTHAGFHTAWKRPESEFRCVTFSDASSTSSGTKPNYDPDVVQTHDILKSTPKDPEFPKTTRPLTSTSTSTRCCSKTGIVFSGLVCWGLTAPFLLEGSHPQCVQEHGAVVRQRDVLYTSQGHIDVRECESERHHLPRMWSGLGTARRKFEEFQRGTQKQLCNWTVHDAVLRTDPEAFLLRIATVSSGLYQASVEMVLESVRSEPLFSYIRKQCRGKWLLTRGLASDIDCQHNVVRRKITQHVIFCTSSQYLTSRDMI